MRIKQTWRGKGKYVMACPSVYTFCSFLTWGTLLTAWAAVLSWGAWRTSDPLCVGCVLLTWDFFYILKALCVLEWLSLFLVLRYTIHVQYAIVIEKVVSVELDFLEFSYISRYYKFSSPLLDRINSTSLWLGQSTFFAFILHSGNLKRIAAGDFGACNYTDFVAEAVGGCEKKFYSNLATDLTADCRYVRFHL